MEGDRRGVRSRSCQAGYLGWHHAFQRRQQVIGLTDLCLSGASKPGLRNQARMLNTFALW